VISEAILEGELVRLRPMQESDLPSFVAWLADRDVTRWLAEMGEPPTIEDEFDWYQRKREDPENVLWAIETLEGRLMGNIELRLAPHAKRAELGVAIHDKTQWNQGYGTDAVCLVLGYAFDELHLNRIELTTDEKNLRAIRVYEKLGFQREGLLRGHRLVDGVYGNTLVMGLLRDDRKRGSA